MLEAYVCFQFQSGVCIEDFGAAISEPTIVTEKDGERLCSGARELALILAPMSRPAMEQQ